VIGLSCKLKMGEKSFFFFFMHNEIAISLNSPALCHRAYEELSCEQTGSICDLKREVS
jgi:hypothetical protein